MKHVSVPILKIDDVFLECVDEFNFLGLHIDKHLSWKKHTQTVSSKVSQITGIMYRLKDFLPNHILLLLYNTLIMPRFNYCILAWGHYLDRLANLQKKAIRIAHHGAYNAHTEPLFKKSNIVKLNDLYKYKLLKFYHKFVNGRLPVYFNNFEIMPASDLHQHNTRGKEKLIVSRVSHTYAKKCIRHELVKLINETPDIIMDKVHTHSLFGFSMYVKKNLITKYEITCQVENCYVCNS